MASIINASSSGSGGIVQTADASGVLQLQSNGTVGLTVSTSGYLGVRDATIGTTALTLRAIANTYTGGALALQDAAGTSKMYLTSIGGEFYVGDNAFNDCAIINQYGVGLGANTPTSGLGVRFPATQSASSDANTLDDYEEGTWTPVFARDGGSPSITYSVQNGVYTKVGNIVCIECLLVVTGISSQGGSGNITVAGFPFTSTKGNSYGRVMLIGYNDVFDDQALTRGWMSSNSMYIMPAGVTQSAYNGTFTTGYFAVAGCYLTD